MDPGQGVREGDYVVISLQRDPAKHMKGKVMQVGAQSESGETYVVLTSGDSGTIVRTINSSSAMEERILGEGQHTENKSNFSEPKMKTESIPKAVQAFLNTDGGYLYVGVRDDGSLEERLVGLGRDFDAIRSNPKLKNAPDDKLCDELEKRVMSSLASQLSSDTSIGSLVTIDFPEIRGVRIMQLVVERSPHPWFYRNLSNNNKVKKYRLEFGNDKPKERHLDEFYVREGNSKQPIDTMEEFYRYAKNRFKYPS